MGQKVKKKYKCQYFGKCGGCDFDGVDYKHEIVLKQKIIEELLSGEGKIEPIIAMDNPYNYRNKIVRSFYHKYGKETISGIYREGTHNIIPVESCLIENNIADKIIKDVTALINSFKLTAYNEDTGYGLIRHILIRTGYHTGEIMVVIVTASPIFPSKNNFVKELRKRHPEITTIVQNINDKKTTMVLGKRNQVIYGKGYIEDILCGKKFRISPQSFYQVNPVQTEKLYNKALEYAEFTGKETVIDAYCGIGTIGLAAADRVKEVIGVELNNEAVKDAIVNCKLNNIKNAVFFNDDAGRFMLNYNDKYIDVVFMDPPRSGSSKEFIDALHRLRPKKIVYISCGPDTLARDLKIFKKQGLYKVEKICPVDMFPGTTHVETVVLLSKEMVDSRKVKVDFSVEDMDLSEFKGKATYEQIKAYVLEQTGLKVSSLYIAQIKKKCGLDVGENFNLPKSENARQPQCTPEKEEAIMQAFRHFGIV